MFFFGHLLTTVAGIARLAINLYSIVVIASAIITWVNADPYNPVVRVLRSLTEPVYFWIRRRLPFVVVGGLDLSPILLLLALQLVNGVVVNSLYDLGLRLL